MVFVMYVCCAAVLWSGLEPISVKIIGTLYVDFSFAITL
jgi:hypothetical protein